ncbi:MAG: DUF4154 domain-containing protein [Flavobacteriales bacterium]|nr:DUF4154 domain-containing protein [Flavobacteriales bacterium]
MKSKSIYQLVKFQKLFFCFLLVFVLSNKTTAQDVKNEQVKRLQRSIFIYNFAQQVGGWPNFGTLETFNVGVLGPDRSVIDLKFLAQKRKIQDKLVRVVRFNSIKELKNVQLLYVNNDYNYDIKYILDKISNKNILLITEDYNYHSSMINMINVGNSFEYEINSELLEQEGFKLAPSLKKYAVSSSQKWKDLYKVVEKSLSNVKEIEAKQLQLLKDKERQILSQKKIINKQKEVIDTTLVSISEKDEWIEQLGTNSELQLKKYEDKLLIERDLERNIKQQIDFIRMQEEKINLSNSEIEKQVESLNKKSIEIRKKDGILKEKNSEINAHRRVNFLLIIIVVITVFGGLYIYRSYFLKKRLNRVLDEKNHAIEQQAVLLELKNNKLEQFNYIATHDLKVPISNLEGYYSFLKEDINTEDEELLDTIYWIGKSIDQSKSMIADLTRIVKSEATLMEKESLSFDVILLEILESLNQEIGKYEADISYDFTACLKIEFGRVELKSILQNLVSNAIKYCSPNRPPKIELRTSLEKEFIVLDVIDNGLGIDLDTHSEDLFKVFRRIHIMEEGSGIGLYMIKNIIEDAGGKIKVKSKLNEGTTFSVYFKIF